jgi:hypothetical protein
MQGRGGEGGEFGKIDSNAHICATMCGCLHDTF